MRHYIQKCQNQSGR